MKIMYGKKLLFVAALVLIIIAGTGTAVSLSISGGGTWKYQREISIKENSGTLLTDYQVLIELKGADFPSEAKSDGADVRFTDSDGNELNYWIERWDYAGKNARIWVKVPSISASTFSIIHLYYGNPNAKSSVDGDKTFEFFDDASGTFTNKWIDIEGSGSYSIIGGKQAISLNSASTNIRTLNYQMSGSFAIDSELYATDLITAIQYYQDSNPSTNERYHARIDIRGRDPYGTASSESIIKDGKEIGSFQDTFGSANTWIATRLTVDKNGNHRWFIGEKLAAYSTDTTYSSGYLALNHHNIGSGAVANLRVRKYTSPEPTLILSQPKSSSLTITKSASPYSLRQFQASTIKVLIENSGTSEVKAIEIMDSIHPSFDLTGGDFPNPKKFDTIRAGESRELQYTIKSKESGAFTLDPATVTYADSEGNIQEVKSEPVSIKVVPSTDGGRSGINTGQNSKSASVSLHGEKTDVVMGEDILLRLSAVNLITKPKMHVQVIIIPPSGMSVTSSEFSKSAAGQFTANYQLEPGDGKDIEVRIRSNQVGDFNVNGRIIYYFGDDKEKSEDQTLNLPIKVRKELVETVPSRSNAETSAKAPGFEGEFAIIGILFVELLIKRRK
jgi:hypothetical protein